MVSHKIRTTFRPDVEIEVGDVELADLTAQGLIAPSTAQGLIAPSAAAAPEGAPKTPEALPSAGDIPQKKESAK